MDTYNNPYPGNYFAPGQGGVPQMAVPQRPAFGGYQPQAQTQPVSNVDFVTSLEEALYKSNTRNSDMYYLDQNKPLIYRIKVDVGGMKSYVILPYTLPDQANNVPATKAEVQALAATVQELTNKVEELQAKQILPKATRKKSGEVVDDESNG